MHEGNVLLGSDIQRKSATRPKEAVHINGNAPNNTYNRTT